jgi:hypothetical protein
MNRIFRNAIVASFCLVGALALYLWRSDGTAVGDVKRAASAAEVRQARASGSVSTATADGGNTAQPRTIATNRGVVADWAHTLLTQSKSAVEALRLLRADSRSTPATLKYFEAFLAETCGSYAPASQSNPDPRTPSEIAQKKLTALSYASCGMRPRRLATSAPSPCWHGVRNSRKIKSSKIKRTAG